MTDLTEKWKTGKLEQGWYYVRYENNIVDIEFAQCICFGNMDAMKVVVFKNDCDVKEVLREVPILDELQELKSKRDKLAYDLGVADTKNGELLRLLKEWVEAYPVVAVTCDLKNFAKIQELLDKTNEVLK